MFVETELYEAAHPLGGYVQQRAALNTARREFA